MKKKINTFKFNETAAYRLYEALCASYDSEHPGFRLKYLDGREFRWQRTGTNKKNFVYILTTELTKAEIALLLLSKP